MKYRVPINKSESIDCEFYPVYKEIIFKPLDFKIFHGSADSVYDTIKDEVKTSINVYIPSDPEKCRKLKVRGEK